MGLAGSAELPDIAPFLPEMEDMEEEPEGLAAS